MKNRSPKKTPTPSTETPRTVTLKIPQTTNDTLDALALVYGLSKTKLTELAVITAREVWNTHGKIELQPKAA